MSENSQSHITIPALPEKPRRKKWPWITGAAVVVAAVAAAVVVPLVNHSSPAAAGEKTVRLGVVDAGASYWKLVAEKAKDKGINLQLVSFSDYATPNRALTNGDIDLNKFQHVRYLAQYNTAQNQDLVPVGAGEIYPIGFYSKKWKTVAEVPQGAEVTLSNNPANQVRPLLALKEAGLIQFKSDPGWSAKLSDVDYSKSRIGKITPIDPTQTAASLDSVDVAFVDSQFAKNAKLTKEQEIYRESADRDDLTQYVNIFAARKADENKQEIKDVVSIFQSDEVKKAFIAENGDEAVFKTDVSVDTLKKTLAEQSEQFKK